MCFAALICDPTMKFGVTPTAALEQFTDGSRLPLDSLPLAKAHLSDRLLANLVAAHRSRLTSLDISDAQVWCTASCSCTTFCFTCVSEYNGVINSLYSHKISL
uniref:Uncharacterized protein n=1 Tax=Ascaris lumbricoides TaxID=6252 RepID=A0A0M3HKS0_ASCLU